MSTISAGNTLSTSFVITGDTTGNLILSAQSNVVNLSTNTGALIVPSGTTAQRPTGVNGMVRYNSTTSAFEVYANNTWATSNVTTPPVNTVAPVVTGSTLVGGTVNTTTGTWTNSPSTYYYQWYANSTAISANGTSNFFVVTSAQLGANLTCNVTAFNAAGNSTPATSNSVGPVVSGFAVSYLMVAGGGGGGGNAGGGGGAGGYLTGTTTFTPSSVYTITVGGGGNPGSSGGSAGTRGSNSSITGLTTAVGGGGGGGNSEAGTSGGSGGGGGSGGPGQSGTTGQGNAGGSGGSTKGGGGGGANAAGQAAGSNGGNGGNGNASSITGSSVTYAGGGGGAAFLPDGASGGSGGTGGGGNSTNNGTGSNGGTNLGGGAGGGSPGNGGGSGGKGIVIISIATANYTGTTTGSPTVTTSGGNTILQYTNSGTYTA